MTGAGVVKPVALSEACAVADPLTDGVPFREQPLVASTGNRSRPRKGDRHKFPGNGSAMRFGRSGRPSKKHGKIEPVPGP
jgi:hypothetical protein